MGQHDLKNVAGRNIFFGFQHIVHVLLANCRIFRWLGRFSRRRRRFIGRQLQWFGELVADLAYPRGGLCIDFVADFIRCRGRDFGQIDQFGGMGQMVHRNNQPAKHKFAESHIGR